MRFLIAIVLLVCAPGVTLAFIRHGGSFLTTGTIAVPFAAGLLLGIFVDQVILRRAPAIETFEHELTHALCAIVFMRRIVRFVVRRDGAGAVQHQGRFGGTLGDDVIGLAPYFLPTFTIVMTLVRPLLGPRWFPGFDVGIGGTFGFHLWTTVRETRENWTGRAFPDAVSGRVTQTDIAERGFVYSFLFIAAFGLAIAGLLAAILSQGYAGIPAWAHSVWGTTSQVWSWGVRTARSIAS
jgi:hypothetical protein